MTMMDLTDVLNLIDQADVIVARGFISTACRIGNDWHLTVLDCDTRAKADTLVVRHGGTVDVMQVVR